MKPHVNLIIATPGHSVMGGYLKSLLATVEMLNARGITWAFTNDYSSHVADAREVTLSGTRNNDVNNNLPLSGEVTYDKIIWIDSDIFWTPEDVIKLYESDKDIISGAYLLGSGEVTAYAKMLDRGFTYDEVKEMTEPIKVEAIGFGFVCVKQGVFEQLSRPWFQSVEVTKTFDDGKEFKFMMMGEDMSWCKRVLNLGLEIWFDPSIKVTHNKMMKLTWEGVRP